MHIALGTTWHTGHRIEGPRFKFGVPWECPMKGALDKVPLYVSKKKCITREKLNLSALAEVRKVLAALDKAGTSPIASAFLRNSFEDLEIKKKEKEAETSPIASNSPVKGLQNLKKKRRRRRD